MAANCSSHAMLEKNEPNEKYHQVVDGFDDISSEKKPKENAFVGTRYG